MNIVCSVGDTYLLEPQREPIVGWHHRPGTFRVATPYDRAPPSHKDNHGSTSDDRDTAQSGQRKKPKISNSTTEIPVVAQSPEENLAQWIRSRLIAVLDQPLAKTFVQNMALDYFYGTLVDTPASNELAPDFVNLQSVLQLLRSGFSGAPEPNLKEILLSESHQTLDLDDMYETIVSNNQSEPAVITVHSATRPRFIIPPRSTFIISDLDKIHDLKAIACQRGGFDIIVMDPPWQNASVDRQARYNTIDLYDLFKIPVPELLKNDTDIVAQEAVGGLVAVWITNRNKVKKMVLEKLFPAWDLELVGHWYWLKITTRGEPVLDLENRHRSAHEGVLIGRRKLCLRVKQSRTQRGLSTDKANETSDPTSSEVTAPVLNRRLLVSVPSQHSRKPSLMHLLKKEYFPRAADQMFLNHETAPKAADSRQGNASEKEPGLNRLELFARNMEEGVVSWGNEPIRFQYGGSGSVCDGYLVPGSLDQIR